jgi:sugar phosphate isomerase/epimerase
MGYDAVDFRGLTGQMEIWKQDAFAGEAGATARRIAASGLAVSAFSSSARMYNPDAQTLDRSLEEVRQYANLCPVFGARVLRIFGGQVPDRPIARAIPVAIETLRRMAEIAGPEVTLAVETHDDWVRSSPLAEVISGVALPNVKVLWDLHHPFRMAGEKPEETYARIGRWVVATHLKDSRLVGQGKWTYVLPGEGDVPLEQMVALLKAGGYDGYLTLEWEKRWCPEIADPEVALPAWAKYLRKLAERPVR